MTTPAFAELQRRLVERLRDTTPEAGASAIVVCPSITFPVTELRKIIGIQFYEERLLFLTLLLANPELELLYPTSVPIDEAAISYYLSWLPDPADARRRLHLFSVEDPEPSALTDKLLALPDVIVEMRQRLRDPETAFILPFNVTASEAMLAEWLGLPIYGTPPDLVHLGSKSGSREVALEAAVDVFAGAGDLYSLNDVSAAIAGILAERPTARAVVVKLNNGFSGQGNVILERDAVRSPLETSPATFCASEESWETFGPKIAVDGGVVEELAREPGTVSPSVQVRILPGGRSEIVSTHDQILGGPDSQVYLGCRFPARDEYRTEICAAARAVAEVLARRGVLGSFGIDFVVVPGQGIYLSEINLRLGGTTHPFLMTRFITGGTYDQSSGQLLVEGEPRVYKSSDNVKSPAYLGLQPEQLIKAVADAGLEFDPESKTGTTLHLLGALSPYGKYGLVCIARTADEADAQYERVLQCVEDLAQARSR